MKNEFYDLFPEDEQQYLEFKLQYLRLTTENYSEAFKLTQTAWELAERWNEIHANASKLAQKGTNKTDLQKYCYGKYRQLHLAFEHCRMIWARGEDANRFQRGNR